VVLAALSGAPAWAQSTTSWSQFQGGAGHPGSLADGVAPPYRQTWRFDPGLTGRFGVSAPVLEGDLAVTVGPRAVYGVDLATGEAAWELPREYGPVAAPAIVAAEGGSALVYTVGYGSDPPEEAFGSPTPGASTEASPTPSPTTSPEPTGEEAGFESRVVAVDLGTREPVWDAPVELPAISRTGVTVDGDTAVVGSDDGTITAIDTATGTERWTYEAPGPVSTTIAMGEGIVVLSTLPRPSKPAFVVALDAGDGSESWRYQPTSVPFWATIPSIADGVVYLGSTDVQSGSRMRALSLSDGAERWATAANSQFSPYTAPVPASELVYGVDYSGQISALDLATGDRPWDFALNTVVGTGPVSSGSTLLVTTTGGTLVAIDTGSHDLVARVTVAGPRGYLGAMALTPDLVVAVVGGHQPGLVGFEHDAETPLLAEASPTVLEAGTMLVTFGLVALPMVLILLVAGRWLRGRIGPAFADDEDLEP
jgi:outer membrane protein assembly factor BamB